jgi:hypothetical protein
LNAQAMTGLNPRHLAAAESCGGAKSVRAPAIDITGAYPIADQKQRDHQTMAPFAGRTNASMTSP